VAYNITVTNNKIKRKEEQKMVEIINKDIFKGIAGARPTEAPKYFILHNDAGSMSAKDYIGWLQSRYDNGQSELGFAHYYIDRNAIVRVENTYNGSWSTANYEGNMNSIGYEVCQQFSTNDVDFRENEEMCLRQMAEDMKYYGVEPNYDTIKLHNEFSATSCPARTLELHGNSNNSVRDFIIRRIKHYMSLGNTVQEMIDAEIQKPEGWVKDEKGWWYRRKDGTYPVDINEMIGNEWFQFDKDGYALINKWYFDGTFYYYHDARGASIRSRWAQIDGKWYYFNLSGEMQKGWVKYKDHWFYCDAQNGDMKSDQYIKHGEGWYYVKPNGEIATKEAFTIEPDGLITVKK
jgi:gametolysin